MAALAHILHLTIPHKSNNYRARLLQPIGLFTLLTALVLSQFFLQSYAKVKPGVLGYAANISVDEVIRLTNQKRTDSGLAALQVNSKLSQAAEAKGRHMLEHDYWAHIAPDGTEPWTFFVNTGYKYRYAGENLARDFSNPTAAVDAWIASPSHRDNLLSPKYTEIGIGVVEGDLNGVDTTLIVQLFGTPMSSNPVPVADNPTTPQVAADTEVSPPQTIEEPSEEVAVEEEVIKLNNNNQTVISASEPVISPADIGKLSATFMIGLLFFLLVVDIAVLKYKKVPRNTGRPLAHISFFALIFAIILIAKSGSII